MACSMWKVGFIVFSLHLTLLFCFAYSDTFPNKEFINLDNSCFCELKGEIDDCSCKIDNVDDFNNLQIYPRLQSLVTKTYFRYFKVNLQKGCHFWKEDHHCVLKDCHVDICSENEIPEGFKDMEVASSETDEKDKNAEPNCQEQAESDRLGQLNTTIGKGKAEIFKEWQDFETQEFCALDDASSEGMEYVDLLVNPERYTGYRGKSAHRIWNSIYNENCFMNEHVHENAYEMYMMQTNKECLEKRVFYRLVSGLHASINIHLSAKYLLQRRAFPTFTAPVASDERREVVWGHNVDEFVRRFSANTTQGKGPSWLKNLYFIYLVELRALSKVAPMLLRNDFFTGDFEEDTSTKEAVIDLMKTVRSFNSHFDEGILFSRDSAETDELKLQFKSKFRNVTRIMDCVGCEKCRLWGKLQTQGLGTALKILLFAPNDSASSSTGFPSDIGGNGFSLKRTEIISLFNSLARLSESIREVEIFRQELIGGSS